MSTIFTLPHQPITWGAIPQDVTGNVADVPYMGIYATETTQRYIYGTRYLTWDGKVYKYSLAGAACYTLRLNYFWNSISSDVAGIDYSLLTNAQVAGDTEITLTNGTTAVAEDYLAGGLAVIVPTEATTDAYVMRRGIVGNEVAAASAECRIFLDAPLSSAVAATNYAYVMPSHYNNIRFNGDIPAIQKSFAGLAAVYAASSYKFWLQTYGPCQIAAQNSVGKTEYYREVWARYDGTVNISSGLGTNVSDQCVGFIMDNNVGANGATNIMLTISY